MSLGVVIKGPEGIVLAADSRVTLEAQRQGQVGQAHVFSINYDNASKTLTFKEPHSFVGAVTYGLAAIGAPPRTAHSFLPEFDVILEKKERLSVLEYSKELSAFFMNQWKKVMREDYQGPNMTFVVGGYDKEKPYGEVFIFEIPGDPDPKEKYPDKFGMSWGGQLQIASRLIHGYDPRLLPILQKELNLPPEQIQRLMPILNANLQFPIPFDILPLQDCVNLALLLLRTTISAQNLSVDIRGVGGDIDLAVITRTEGLRYLQKKELYGEARFSRRTTHEPT